jgi:hypothetical protein
MGGIRPMKNLFLRALIALRIARPRKQLFFVLKFGGKIYLKMTEDQLRAEIAKAGEVGVQYRDKSLVFQVYEIDPSAEKKKPPGV